MFQLEGEVVRLNSPVQGGGEFNWRTLPTIDRLNSDPDAASPEVIRKDSEPISRPALRMVRVPSSAVWANRERVLRAKAKLTTARRFMAGKNIAAKFGTDALSPTWLDRRACWVALLTGAVAAEWLRAPAIGWVAAAALIGLVALVGGWRAGRSVRAVSAACLLVVGALAVGQQRISRIQMMARRTGTTTLQGVPAIEWCVAGDASHHRAVGGSGSPPLADGDRRVAFATLDRDLPMDGPKRQW